MWDVLFKPLTGGALVVVSALIAEMVTPKRLAGIFAAAPSVALAGLVVTVLTKGPTDAASACAGMAVGAVAFTACYLGAVPALSLFGAKTGSATALVMWCGVASTGWWRIR